MPPLGELYRATISYEGSGGLNQNVLHFRADVGEPSAQELVDVMIGTYWPAFRNVLNQSVSLLNVTAQQLTPEIKDPIGGESLTPDGAIVGTPVNSQLSVIFTLRTGLASRRKRGRMYLGNVPNNYINVNILNPFGLGEYISFRNEIVTNFVGDAALTTFQLGVYSRLDGGDGPDYSLAGYTPVTAIQVQSNLGTQRRRRLGRGA